MVGFRTKNSTYWIDASNRLIWGGKLGDRPVRYAPGTQFIIGNCCLAYLVDEYDRQLYNGNRPCYIRTGVIQSYI